MHFLLLYSLTVSHKQDVWGDGYLGQEQLGCRRPPRPLACASCGSHHHHKAGACSTFQLPILMEPSSTCFSVGFSFGNKDSLYTTPNSSLALCRVAFLFIYPLNTIIACSVYSSTDAGSCKKSLLWPIFSMRCVQSSSELQRHQTPCLR